jgi:glycosyltransferase involved in cell wall biosynthesis
LDVLARAFARLAENPRYHLLVVGDGPEREVVRSLEERFPGQVTLAGAVPQSEVGSYLRAMHVAVAPYPRLDRFYYSPLKVLEYMAAGRAIVASRIGQLQALIEHGHTGVLVQPGDDEMLAGAIDGLAEDERHRRALGMAAARCAWSGHRWTHRAEEILRVAAGVAGGALDAGGKAPTVALKARA